MEKQTKNIITREWIEKELRFYNRADTGSTAVLLFILSLVFVPLTVGAVWLMISHIENRTLGISLAILLGVPMSTPVIMHLVFLYKCLEERRLLLKGKFEILVLPLEYKREVLLNRRTEKSLFFKDFERIAVDGTEYELASHGDEYYIVCYENKNTIELIYPTKMYCYKE